VTFWHGARLVLVSIGLVVVVSLVGVVTATMFMSREPTIGQNSVLVLGLHGDLAEVGPRGLARLAESPPTLRSLVNNLRKAKVDSRIKSVVIMPAGLDAFWGKYQELRDAVLDFKKSGKPVIAYLTFPDDRDYYLATACDQIFLMPASSLELTGVANFEVFLHGALEKFGASADMLQIGEYKTAGNMFTEKTFTPEHLAMTDGLNLDLYEQLVHGIAEGRGKSNAEVRAILDQGPFLPKEALRLGLVDGLAYEDELVALSDGQDFLSGDNYRQVSLASVGLGQGPKIALIYAVGTITAGESRYYGPDGQSSVGAATLIEQIRKVRKNDSVRAVILRINSPGGSAIASDAIWRELQLASSDKPLIASMSDVAASGGYYIAMAAHSIVVQPATLTGSIGVIAGKFVLSGVLGKLGVNVETISRGKNATMHSPLRPYSDDERQKLEEQVRATYNLFIEKAAKSRHTTPEKIDEIARGRVWTGRQALNVGLVDELGGLKRAVTLAKQRAGIDSDAEIELVIYPAQESLFDIARNPFGRNNRMTFIRSVLSTREEKVLKTFTVPLELFRRGEPLALLPYISVW
jgi:protease-4